MHICVSSLLKYKMRRVDLAQLIKFLVVKLTHLDLNSIFDICVAFTPNYFFSGRQRPIDSEALLIIDFMNLKIKSTQSLKYACVCS
jgi:hypothetical protein